MEAATPDPNAEDLSVALRGWHQGSVLQVDRMTHVADLNRPLTDPAREHAARGGDGLKPVTSTTPHGLAVISQTCDIQTKSPASNPFVVCARIVELDPQVADEAARHRRSRYAVLPRLGPNFAADLDQTVTVEKSVLANHPPIRGVEGTSEEEAFGFAVGRRFSRFAFPDDVHDTLAPLQELLISKHDKPTSPVGKIARQLVEIRALADPGWDAPSFEITLYFLLPPSGLPAVEDLEDEHVSPELERWVSQKDRGHADLADRLAAAQRDGAGPADVAHLWHLLGDAWAKKCVVRGAVTGVFVEILTEYDMRVSELRRTQMLDLDFLSVSRPADPAADTAVPAAKPVAQG
jgi:hypothetical protein